MDESKDPGSGLVDELTDAIRLLNRELIEGLAAGIAQGVMAGLTAHAMLEREQAASVPHVATVEGPMQSVAAGDGVAEALYRHPVAGFLWVMSPDETQPGGYAMRVEVQQPDEEDGPWMMPGKKRKR